MNRELEFKRWSNVTKNQQGNFFDEKTINKMIEQLKMIIPQKINQIDNIHKYNSLFDIDNIAELEGIKGRLSKKKKGDLYKWDWDEQGHGFGSSAIHRYIKFLNEDYLLKNNSENIRGIRIINIRNIILYGPPGVGKTHNYQRLISLIEEGKEQKEIFDTITDSGTNQKIELDKASFQKIENEKRVEFVCFHQSYSYEDFIEGFRPTEKGNIELEDGIFKKIAEEAKENSYKSVSTDKLLFHDAIDKLLKEKIESDEKVKINLKRDNSYFEIYDYDDKTIYYTRQGKSKEEKYHTLSIKTLKKIYSEEENNLINGGLSPYYNSLLDKLVAIGKEKKLEIKEQKNYYIVIDEINRGNISKIFGELITLIEEDKRDIYEVTLPYSKDKFMIPSNLYIIATMNSTDKSIATIDIALRRRFTFLKMNPNINLVENIEARNLMERLNIEIKEKLGEDFMLGHSYFMGEQIDLDFLKEYKIRPLLEEYFYSDESVDINKLLKGNSNAS